MPRSNNDCARYRVEFVWNGEHHIKDVAAFDYGVSYPKCLTLYYSTGGIIIVDEIGIEKIEITKI